MLLLRRRWLTTIAGTCAGWLVAPHVVVARLAEPSAEPPAEPPADEGDDGPDAPASKVAASVFGVWRFVGGAKQRAAVEAAIEDAIADLSVMIRGIARRRLVESNRVGAVLNIERDERAISIHVPGIRSVSAPSDGSSVEWRSEHRDKVQLSHRLESEAKLVQRFVGEGTRINVYKARGDKLTLSTSISAKRLPKDIHYQLSYARVIKD